MEGNARALSKGKIRRFNLLMILVTLGTQDNSFYRLLEEVQKCIDEKIINEKVVVQSGGTNFKSKDMEIFKLISNQRLNKLIKESSYVITHGGVRINCNSIKDGKKSYCCSKIS